MALGDKGHAGGQAAIGASRLLVVDDDPRLLRALETGLRDEASELRCCASVSEARALLRSFCPDVLLLDLSLPDGSGFDVLDAVRELEPMPLVIAITGTASPAEAFRLAEQGVRGYLHKPFTVAELRAAIERARREPPPLEPRLRSAVGTRPLRELEAEVRETMVAEALARAGGSRKAAARLLGVSRQLLQHILRGRGEKPEQ